MADTKRLRLVNRRTGSVVVVDEERAPALSILGFRPEEAKKAPAKKSASSESSK